MLRTLRSRYLRYRDAARKSVVRLAHRAWHLTHRSYNRRTLAILQERVVVHEVTQRDRPYWSRAELIRWAAELYGSERATLMGYTETDPTPGY